MSAKNPLARHGHVSYLEIPAVDIERSSTFYEAVFDWEIRRGDAEHVSFDDRSGELIGRWVTDSGCPASPGYSRSSTWITSMISSSVS
jgi:uncharacterized protein